MSSHPELATLRSTLADLQSFTLPSDYHSNTNGDFDKENAPNTNGKKRGAVDDNTTKKGFANPHLLTRYKSARNTYIQQQTIESFLRSLTKYNPDTHTLPMPDTDAIASHHDEMNAKSARILDEVHKVMQSIESGMMEVGSKWEQFVEKREELMEIVEGYERTERNRRLQEGDDDDNDEELNDNNNNNMEEEEEEITEEDVALQKEKLEDLQQKRHELQNKLQSVKAKIVQVEEDVHLTKRGVNEVRVRNGCTPLDWRGLRNDNMSGEEEGSMSQESNVTGSGDSPNTTNSSNVDEQHQNNVEYISSMTSTQQGVVDNEISQMETQAAKLQESTDFYDGMRELMEELGGVKILSSTGRINANDNGGDDEGKEGGGEFVLTLSLLGNHILEITLSKSSEDKDGLHIQSAKLTTQTSFPIPESSQTTTDGEPTTTTMNEQTISLMETMHSISHCNISFSKIMSQRPSESFVIPPLDDLVLWSQSLESSSHGIRFILVETLGRLRTMEARTEELRCLRERYAAQIYDVEGGSGTVQYGGAEQEVVCAINEGITVALRLGADCPLVPGSVYISEIFGVGGWEESKLETLKRVVMEKRCRGPMDVMKCLVKEVKRRSKEDGWVVPATPSLPRGK